MRGSPEERAPARGASGETIPIRFTLNGRSIEVAVEPAERLLDLLRYRLGLTGTKEGCGEGECGACTVWMNGLPVDSCLVFAWQAREADVRSVEAVSPADVEALLVSGATQCGACTPGIVMTGLWLTEHPEILRERSLREMMAGNLCRCTGYDGVVEGVARALAARGVAVPEGA